MKKQIILIVVLAIVIASGKLLQAQEDYTIFSYPGVLILPSAPPGIWDWGSNEIPSDVTPFGIIFRYVDHYNCRYPR